MLHDLPIVYKQLCRNHDRQHPNPTQPLHRGWPTLPFAKALVLLRLRILPEVYAENSRCDRPNETETEVEVQVTLLLSGQII